MLIRANIVTASFAILLVVAAVPAGCFDINDGKCAWKCVEKRSQHVATVLCAHSAVL